MSNKDYYILQYICVHTWGNAITLSMKTPTVIMSWVKFEAIQSSSKVSWNYLIHCGNRRLSCFFVYLQNL